MNSQAAANDIIHHKNHREFLISTDCDKNGETKISECKNEEKKDLMSILLF